MKLIDCEMLFVDCQTTGSSPATGGLLEIAWAKGTARNLDEIAYRILQQPYNQVPPRITELTGITDDDLKEAISQRKTAASFRASLVETPRSVIHYAKFEKPFLDSLLFDPIVNYGRNDHFEYSVLCTHEIVRRLYPNFPARGIKAIAGFFGQQLNSVKRASAHVNATWIIWKHLVEALAAADIYDLEQLQAFLAEPCSHKRGKYVYPVDRKKRLGLPEVPGVYRLMDRQGHILYVGKATSLKTRVNSYFRGQKKNAQLLEMLAQISDIDVTTCDTVVEAAVLEADEIKRHNPPYNDALKETGRQILFSSRDFKRRSAVPDDDHPLGPFTSAWSLDCLVRLSDGAATGLYSTRIFMDQVHAHLISRGVEKFCERWNVTRKQLSDPRFCMALGARLARKEARGEVKLETEQTITKLYGQLHIDSLRLGTDVIIKAERVITELPLDAEEVSWKIARLLARTAQSYLRTRRLTRLLNCNILVESGGASKRITVANGLLVSEAGSDFAHAHYSAWQGKTVADYDRISVLFKELQRVKHQISV